MPTLKDLRNAARLSQTELANASGVSLETIKKIESGKVERPHPATLRLLAAVLGQVPVVMNGSRGGPVFDPGMFDNARRDEAACLRIVGEPGFVPLRQTTLSGTIVGPLAHLELTQLFSYSRIECDRVLEAIYRFPLPGDAAVTSVRVHFGQAVVQTRLAERAEAEREYVTAREQGRQAALATRESADVFTLQITGLQPDQPVRVHTSFVQAATSEGVGWQLRVPLTIGPRYSRPDEAGSPARRGQPLQVWRDPRHRFSVDLRVCRAERIVSPSHALRVPDGERVSLADGAVIPDRDFVIGWQPRQQQSRPALEVLTHEELGEGMRYFLALVTPPARAHELPGVEREILLLVDHSGSMEGPKWQACRWAVRRFLAGLAPTDTFNLGLFQSRCDWFGRSSVAGTEPNRQQALAFLEAHAPQGGTELGIALEQALRFDRAPGERARHVLIVTDAQVSDESRILQLVEREAEREDRRRVSVISIDSAPRSAFVRSLAEASGGEAVFLSSDPHQEDITSALDRVLDRWARPLACDVELSVEAGAANVQARHAAGVTRSRYALGDLTAGRSLWVCGAVSLFSEPIIRLRVGHQVVAEHVLSLEESSAELPAVRALFGARQINRLERLEAQTHDADARDAMLDELGYANDPLRAPQAPPLYAENAQSEGSVVRKLLVRESLRFGLVCSATAFVGERIEAGMRSHATVQVPSALPDGWSSGFTTLAAPAAARGFERVRAAPEMAQPRFMPYFEKAAPAAPVPSQPLGLRYRGMPRLVDGSALLAEGVAGRDLGIRLGRLHVEVGNLQEIDPTVEVWICLDDSPDPLVRLKLTEVVALGGERPLNVAVAPHATVRVMLKATAPWPRQAGQLVIELG